MRGGDSTSRTHLTFNVKPIDFVQTLSGFSCYGLSRIDAQGCNRIKTLGALGTALWRAYLPLGHLGHGPPLVSLFRHGQMRTTHAQQRTVVYLTRPSDKHVGF
jgi:hypothetical protein